MATPINPFTPPTLGSTPNWGENPFVVAGLSGLSQGLAQGINTALDLGMRQKELQNEARWRDVYLTGRQQQLNNEANLESKRLEIAAQQAQENKQLSAQKAAAEAAKSGAELKSIQAKNALIDLLGSPQSPIPSSGAVPQPIPQGQPTKNGWSSWL
ncbi:MAG: hypothetical protein KGL39_14440 [Patescibacteria group bacterium]|nr:hypothetical protein [Patescibacteria group bacterium]